MKKRLIGTVLAATIAVTLLAGCGSNNAATANGQNGSTGEEAAAGDATAADGMKITILNTKSEIQPQWEELAAEYKELTGVEVEVSVTVGDSPSEDITKRYASGGVPTIFMGDVQDIVMLKEYAADLTGEKWAADGGTKYGVSQDGKLIGFPFCIEARGLMYNKTAIETVTGETFDPKSIKSLDQLKELLDKLVAGGMETPVALNKEDWSLAGHYLSQVYEEQDGTAAGAQTFAEGLKDGSQDLKTNARWNSLMDTFDVLMQYNMNQADPLAADYNANAVALAEGDIALWFNGNWAWAEMSDFVIEGNEYGIMPLAQPDSSNGAVDKLAGGASKYCMIDTKHNSEQQQQAAKDFLNWLVYDEKGQDFLVNKCNLVPAFGTIELEVTNDLGKSVQGYTVEGNLIEGYPGLPGDHWKTLGAEMQKYLGGQVDRNQLAENITAYWKNLK